MGGTLGTPTQDAQPYSRGAGGGQANTGIGRCKPGERPGPADCRRKPGRCSRGARTGGESRAPRRPREAGGWGPSGRHWRGPGRRRVGLQGGQAPSLVPAEHAEPRLSPPVPRRPGPGGVQAPGRSWAGRHRPEGASRSSCREAPSLRPRSVRQVGPSGPRQAPGGLSRGGPRGPRRPPAAAPPAAPAHSAPAPAGPAAAAAAPGPRAPAAPAGCPCPAAARPRSAPG